MSRRPTVLPPPVQTVRLEPGPCADCRGTVLARLRSGEALCLTCGRRQA